MASRRGITTMFLTARRLRLLLRIFLALLLVLSVLLATAFYLLQRNPEALTRHYLDGISARTGLIDPNSKFPAFYSSNSLHH